MVQGEHDVGGHRADDVRIVSDAGRAFVGGPAVGDEHLAWLLRPCPPSGGSFMRRRGLSARSIFTRPSRGVWTTLGAAGLAHEQPGRLAEADRRWLVQFLTINAPIHTCLTVVEKSKNAICSRSSTEVS